MCLEFPLQILELDLNILEDLIFLNSVREELFEERRDGYLEVGYFIAQCQPVLPSSAYCSQISDDLVDEGCEADDPGGDAEGTRLREITSNFVQ